MKRYLIFGAIGPFVGGMILLFVTSYLAGYWTDTNLMEIERFFIVLFKSLQFSYLFGVLPALMIAALDEIICHFHRIGAVVRMLIIGTIGFVVTAFMYSGRGSDAGAAQFALYGFVGLAPAVLSSWLAHKFCDPVVPKDGRPAAA
jgi:hypothetical protein